MTKRKFTWLDGLCILLVLAVAAVAVWYFTKNDTPDPATTEYEVTLRFEQVTTDPHDFYKVGDELYFFTRSAKMGTIQSIEVKDLVREKYTAETATFSTYVDPLHKMIELKVQVYGAVIDGKFTVEGETFAIGGVFYPQSNTTRSVMTVWDIQEVAQ